jgi:hypothetical protein
MVGTRAALRLRGPCRLSRSSSFRASRVQACQRCWRWSLRLHTTGQSTRTPKVVRPLRGLSLGAGYLYVMQLSSKPTMSDLRLVAGAMVVVATVSLFFAWSVFSLDPTGGSCARDRRPQICELGRAIFLLFPISARGPVLALALVVASLVFAWLAYRLFGAAKKLGSTNGAR